MAKSSRHRKKGGNLVNVNLKILVGKLKRSLLLGKKSNSNTSSTHQEQYYNEEIRSDSTCVPEDVKEGHFAVKAVGDGEEVKPKRFVVPLSCLTHPPFLRLLEQAAEEYGFDQEGAITIPCRPSELERILADDDDQQCLREGNTTTPSVGFSWDSCKTMVQSY